MRYVYQVCLDPVDDTILVTAPDVPMLASEGADRAEALANAQDALGVALLHLAGSGEDVPLPKTDAGPGLFPVALGLADALKLDVMLAVRTAGLSVGGCAKLLRIDESDARRLLDPAISTKVDALEDALKRLGRQPVLEVEDAA